MNCYRFDLHRKYLSYLHGQLPSTASKKTEFHLSKCTDCRDRMERLQSTDALLRDLPRTTPANDRWPGIQGAFRQSARFQSYAPLWKRVAVVAAFGLISGLVGAVTYGKLVVHEGVLDANIRPGEFKPVSITRMADTTEPHVVTEGYVIESKVERDDGDTVFKLVDRLNSSGPFVICEVIDPLNLPIPPVGSRVRVYGVSRYDARSDHRWHEVHPVLNIEILKN